MRRLLLPILLFFCFLSSHAQVEQTITVPYTTSKTPTYQALLYLPSDYSTSGKRYPLLVFCHSWSEAADGSSAGTGLAKIYNQAQKGGPAYYIEHGQWPATFTNPVTGAQEQFIVVSPQSNDWSMNGDQLANIVNYLVATYRVDSNRIHLTGVSAGGEGVVEYAAQLTPSESTPSLTKDVRRYKPADIVPMSAATSNDPSQTWGNIDVADSIPVWAFGDPRNDLYGGYMQDFYNVVNKAKAGYAHFTNFTTGHGPWNPFYVTTYTENFTWKNIKSNYNIYTWMLSNSRVALPVAPVANAGTAQTIQLPVSSATLSGSLSSGTITSYSWTQVSGPSTATIGSPGAVTTTVSGLVQGVYVFKLAVTGGSTATVQITVNPAPVANAGSAQTIQLPVSSATLSGSASTGTISSYSWTQVSGPSTATIGSPSSVRTSVSGLVEGVYVFQLAVTGGSTATVQITVVTPPLAVNAGAPQTITLPVNKVLLTGNGSTGIITSYSWSQVSGPVADTIVSADSANTWVTGLMEGVYVFQLTVNGDSTATVQVTVVSPPLVANAGASQNIVLPVSTASLNGSASTGIITSYAWSQVSGPSTATIASPSAVNTSVTDLVGGVYVFELTLNGESTDTVQVTVATPPLVAHAGASQTLYLPASTATLNASASSGLITAYTWSQVSGPSTANLLSPTDDTTIVTGLVQGVYVFRLAVIDIQGSRSTDTMTVTVNNGVITKQINVQVYGGTNPYSNSAWNSWNVNANYTSPAFKYSDGTASTVTGVLSINESVVDNGASYGGGMAPAQVLRYSSYCETTRTLTLSNLKTTATYNFELYASRSSNSGQKSVFTVSGKSDTVLSYNNLTSKAVFTGIAPTSQGKIVITIATPTGYNYLNGFAITETSQTTGTGGAASSVVAGTAAVFASTDSAAAAGAAAVVIYPNPVSNALTLHLNTPQTGAMKIQLMNAAGVNVLSYEGYKAGTVYTTLLPVGDLRVGVYFLTVQIGNWRVTRTVLKN